MRIRGFIVAGTVLIVGLVPSPAGAAEDCSAIAQETISGMPQPDGIVVIEGGQLRVSPSAASDFIAAASAHLASNGEALAECLSATPLQVVHCFNRYTSYLDDWVYVEGGNVVVDYGLFIADASERLQCLLGS